MNEIVLVTPITVVGGSKRQTSALPRHEAGETENLYTRERAGASWRARRDDVLLQAVWH